VQTLALVRRLSQNALVKRVDYVGLDSHPQYALAIKQGPMQGAVLAFEVEGGRDTARRVIDGCKMISISANLGDTKTTITYPATMPHARLTQAEHEAVGITEGLVRVAVGLENINDIEADLARGLAA
jgi:O-succinylhomoserine sulfhydrylase